jgi:hypothetical protein
VSEGHALSTPETWRAFPNGCSVEHPPVVETRARTRLSAEALAFATALTSLLALSPAASAQVPPSCDQATSSAIQFQGLPTGTAPLRHEAFGFRENYDTESYVSSRITVDMADRFGTSFFSGSVHPDARGGELFYVQLDPGDRRATITATFVESNDVGGEDCTRVIQRTVAENPPMRLTIRATRHGVRALGPYRIRPNPTLGNATRAFGHPSRARRFWGGNGCRVSWPLIGLVIQFANFGGQDACSRRYGLAQSAAIRGDAGKHWRTARGLRIGHALRRLRRSYPSAERHGRVSWWLAIGRTFIGPSCAGGPCPYAVLSASVGSGRVSAFRLWVGSAGD